MQVKKKFEHFLRRITTELTTVVKNVIKKPLLKSATNFEEDAYRRDEDGKYVFMFSSLISSVKVVGDRLYCVLYSFLWYMFNVISKINCQYRNHHRQ